MSSSPLVLITGGAGFLGSNLADRFAREGWSVRLFDSLARANVEENLAWLLRRHGSRIQFVRGDVRDCAAVGAATKGAGLVLHLAAQVAVTTSLADPVADFEVNARGTLNLLEALRAQKRPPALIFASTNKVYGHLDHVSVEEKGTRYAAVDPEIRDHGVSERTPLSLYSPYGCSKGAADQYVLDYARVYGIPALVFRMSCLYGYRQFGTEDQGWVAHFLISALKGAPITIYGDGKQVRDVLFVDDVVNAFLTAQKRFADLKGQPYNIGGGPANAVSLRELLKLVGDLLGRPPQVRYGPGRLGDQLYYVSDTRRFQALTGWRPRIDVESGVMRLLSWLRTRESRLHLPEPERVPA